MVRDAIPDVAITTDIIVGFPGETEDDFEETLSLVEEARYDAAYTFQYSPRPMTEAADDGRSSPQGGRAGALRAAGRAAGADSRSTATGATSARREVLVEGPSKKDAAKLTGRTQDEQARALPERRLRGRGVPNRPVSTKRTPHHLEGVDRRRHGRESRVRSMSLPLVTSTTSSCSACSSRACPVGVEAGIVVPARSADRDRRSQPASTCSARSAADAAQGFDGCDVVVLLSRSWSEGRRVPGGARATSTTSASKGVAVNVPTDATAGVRGGSPSGVGSRSRTRRPRGRRCRWRSCGPALPVVACNLRRGDRPARTGTASSRRSSRRSCSPTRSSERPGRDGSVCIVERAHGGVAHPESPACSADRRARSWTISSSTVWRPTADRWRGCDPELWREAGACGAGPAHRLRRALRGPARRGPRLRPSLRRRLPRGFDLTWLRRTRRCAIVGPTAAGKTALALDVAASSRCRDRLGRLDADLPGHGHRDRQADGRDAGSRPAPPDRPVEPGHPLTVSEYQDLGRAAIEDIAGAWEDPAPGRRLRASIFRAIVDDLRFPPRSPEVQGRARGRGRA